MLRILLPAGILLWPLAEIACFILVGRRIGVWPTLSLVVLSAIIGVVLMRIQGLGALTRLRQSARDGGTPGKDLLDAAMIVLAGFLLLVPGFLTDIVGLALFFPPFRTWIWNRLVRNIVVVDISPGNGMHRSGRRQDRTIELEKDEFKRDGDA